MNSDQASINSKLEVNEMNDNREHFELKRNKRTLCVVEENKDWTCWVAGTNDSYTVKVEKQHNFSLVDPKPTMSYSSVDEQIKFLEECIVGVKEAIERHDTLTEEQRQHWVSTKEELIKRQENFQNIIGNLKLVEVL